MLDRGSLVFLARPYSVLLPDLYYRLVGSG